MARAKRYRVQTAHQDKHGTRKPHECIETDDVDEALDVLERFLDNEPDDVLITFLCRPLKQD